MSLITCLRTEGYPSERTKCRPNTRCCGCGATGTIRCPGQSGQMGISLMTFRKLEDLACADGPAESALPPQPGLQGRCRLRDPAGGVVGNLAEHGQAGVLDHRLGAVQVPHGDDG